VVWCVYLNGASAVPGKIRNHACKIFCQGTCEFDPRCMVLRVTVQQQERCAAPPDMDANPLVSDQDHSALEAWKDRLCHQSAQVECEWPSVLFFPVSHTRAPYQGHGREADVSSRRQQANFDHVIMGEARKMPREPSMASYVECEKN